MVWPSHELIQALRTTAKRLSHGAAYKWSDFACCNCGQLVQSITQLSPREIYEAAFLRSGDWGEQARDFCASSGYPIDYVLSRLFELGLTPEDVQHLERLSDVRVLRELSEARGYVREPNSTEAHGSAREPNDGVALRYTRREDVVSYLNGWARLLERQLAASSFFSERGEGARSADSLMPFDCSLESSLPEAAE